MNTQVSDKTLELRKKLNSRKIYFRDMMPTKQVLKERLSAYESDYINLKEFDGKLYDDPYFGQEMAVSKVLYTGVEGDWLIDEEMDEFYQTPIVKLTDNKSGQTIKFAFPDQTNKLIFLNEMNVSSEIKQENSGMAIGDVVNKNVLYPKEKILTKVWITAVVAGIGMFTYLKKKNERKFL